MNILAFETSCDDTAIAVVKDGTHILGSSTISQCHANWGGVVPEVAARLHAKNWIPALKFCLKSAHLSLSDIDLIAATQGPGLQTSLLTGTISASFFSVLYGKKLIPVDHIFGHLCAIFLEREKLLHSKKFPLTLALTVSGGHTQMHLWSDFTTLKRIGNTRDDACGEVFDKTAKMLEMPYPGGPHVSKMAEEGNRNAFDLPRIYLEKESLDFSFSGLKAAVFRKVEAEKTKHKKLSLSFKKNLCASFEQAVSDTFIEKIKRAIAIFPKIERVVFVGGVSANKFIKTQIQNFLEIYGIEYLTPKQISFSTDNAAMIASAGYIMHRSFPQKAKIQCIEPFSTKQQKAIIKS